METLNAWLSLDSLLWTVLRVCSVWLALHGVGSLVKRIGHIRCNFRLMPAFALGILVYMAAVLVLSILHILTRNILAMLVLAGASYGLGLIYMRLRRFLHECRVRLRNPLVFLACLVAIYLAATDLMLAGRPELNFNDTQVTYLVQPDRWLASGRIFFLDETKFSAFPLTSEMLLLLPSSLASDRLDQIILGQVFCMSILLALIFSSMKVLRFEKCWLPTGLIAILGCTLLVLWSHFAKPDSAVLLFVTLSLCILLRQMHDPQNSADMSAFVLMGMALATKYTAYLVLIPFGLMYAHLAANHDYSLRKTAAAAALAAVLPLAFAIRTFVHTGAPFFPNAPFGFMLRPEWTSPDIRLVHDAISDRSSPLYPNIGLLENVWHYFRAWGTPLLLLLAGLFAGSRSAHRTSRVVVLTGIVLYSALSLVIFYPAWWGVKYGMLLIPFAGLFGMYMFKESSWGLLAATVISLGGYLIYDTPLSPTERWGIRFRAQLAKAYFTGEWPDDVNLDMVELQPELGVTLWMNHNLPDGSTVMSFSIMKRYFSDHQWIAAWRYPRSRWLYSENDLEAEIALLLELGVDYIVITTADPAPGNEENDLQMLAHIGPGNLLEPIVEIDGQMVLKVNWQAI